MPDLSLEGLGVPAFLVGAVIVIALATLFLHLLFPPVKKGDSRPITLPNLPIRCPLCQQLLDEVERNGIRIEVCPVCQGVWLSQDKLEQIVS